MSQLHYHRGTEGTEDCQLLPASSWQPSVPSVPLWYM